MQLMDRVAGTSFFLPTGLVVSGQVLQVAGGGNALLWQHLFWFLAHPEVYVLILPAMGIVGEIVANNTRKPLWGYKPMVYSLIFLGFISFILWAHHLFMGGAGGPSVSGYAGARDASGPRREGGELPASRGTHPAVCGRRAGARIERVPPAAVVRARFSAAVRQRWADGGAARPARGRHS